MIVGEETKQEANTKSKHNVRIARNEKSPYCFCNWPIELATDVRLKMCEGKIICPEHFPRLYKGVFTTNTERSQTNKTTFQTPAGPTHTSIEHKDSLPLKKEQEKKNVRSNLTAEYKVVNPRYRYDHRDSGYKDGTNHNREWFRSSGPLMPDDAENMIRTIEGIRDPATISLFQRFFERPFPPEERRNVCFKCNERGHKSGDCNHPRPPYRVCYNCGERNYTLRTCFRCALWYIATGGSNNARTRDPKFCLNQLINYFCVNSR
ncbi:uncharacterized protein [Venturia canescens]|uniref:uncharacterized protein n=1 Tax=Venturia canescens TaxID=32260 RepID=UPI001C9C8E15|nr:uncharacterized protein LOC122418175 [Venturia canescens]